MCVPGLQAFLCKEPTQNPSQPTQTLPVKLPTIWPEPAKRGPLDEMNGNDGAVLRKEGHTLLLKAFKTLHGCVVRVCKPSFAINQPRTHHTTPKLHQSIRCLFGQIYSQVGPSRRDKHLSVM